MNMKIVRNITSFLMMLVAAIFAYKYRKSITDTARNVAEKGKNKVMQGTAWLRKTKQMQHTRHTKAALIYFRVAFCVYGKRGDSNETSQNDNVMLGGGGSGSVHSEVSQSDKEHC